MGRAQRRAPEAAETPKKKEKKRKKWNNAKWESVDINALDNKKEAGLLKLNCDKVFNSLQWEPLFTFKETMDFTSNWYKTYYQERVDIMDYTINQINNFQKITFQRGRVWTKQS